MKGRAFRRVRQEWNWNWVGTGSELSGYFEGLTIKIGTSTLLYFY